MRITLRPKGEFSLKVERRAPTQGWRERGLSPTANPGLKRPGNCRETPPGEKKKDHGKGGP